MSLLSISCHRHKLVGLLAAGLLLSSGCQHQQTVSKGDAAFEKQNWDAAVYYYLEALAEEPNNIEYRMALTRARQKAAAEHFRRGTALKEIGRLSEAREELRMTVQLDPANAYAEQMLSLVIDDLKILSMPDGEHTLAQMKAQAREAKVKPPVLDPRSKEPITLSFPRATPVKEIYKAIEKAYGFNILFDTNLRDDQVAVELNDVTSERALELVMQASGHFYKTLDEHSIIVAEDTPQNRREYEDLVIKTFFLSNADVKDVDKLLRSLIEARRLSTNEQLNAITLRDTADKVAIAERLIAINDKAKAEVVIDVELLQLNSGRSSNLGLNIANLGNEVRHDASGLAGPESGGIFLDSLKDVSRGQWYIGALPKLTINLAKSSDEAKLLAQPQLRVTEGEKASLVIGDRIPIPVTSFNTSNVNNNGIVPVTSFQYQEVGIKIDVEPRVHHNREITLTLTIEVSQQTRTVPVENGQDQPVIGTRQIQSVIRLEDGETSLLAGLYQVESKESNTQTPFLSSIPGLGRLFTGRQKDQTTTDLVLTLTPHIVRFPNITEEDLAPLWVGTETRISYFGGGPRIASGSSDAGPFDGKPERNSVEEQTRRKREARERGPAPAGRESFRPMRPLVPSPGGQELVPQGGIKPKGFSEEAIELVPIGKPVEAPMIAGPAGPLQLSLNPSVMSLVRGDVSAVDVVLSGAAGSTRTPFLLRWDPHLVDLRNVQIARAVEVLSHRFDPAMGELELDLLALDTAFFPQIIASIDVEALEPGSAALSFVSGGAHDTSGRELAAALSSATILVLEER